MLKLLASYAVLPLVSISTAHAALVYVDATGGVGGNTTNAATGSLTDWFVIDTGQNNDLWDYRTGRAFAYNGDAFQINSAEQSVLIRTEVSGLSANSTYSGVRLYYIGHTSTAANRNWSLQASVVSDSAGFITYNDGSGTALINSSTDALGTENLGAPSNDTRYWVSLPDVTTDATGSFYVWLNIAADANDRANYDGIAYDNVAIPEPSAFALLGLAGAAFGFNRRRRH